MGIEERKERERLARREAILEAAKAVFAEKGILGATVEEIAEHAEIGKGTIYLYFGVKEEIYTALMEEWLDLLAKRFGLVIDPHLPADENIRRINTAYYRFYQDDPNFFKIHMVCSLSDVKLKVNTARIEERGLACLKLCVDVIEKGIKDGLFSPSVDPWKAAAILWASSEGILFLFERDPEKAKLFNLNVEDLLNTKTELLIRGLMRQT
jgi:AcrR family transcriptional regulator